MENIQEPSPLRHDLTFEITTGGYEVWFSDRIALDRPDLVDQCADWLDQEMEVINLGQVDHRMLMADGVVCRTINLWKCPPCIGIHNDLNQRSAECQDHYSRQRADNNGPSHYDDRHASPDDHVTGCPSDFVHGGESQQQSALADRPCSRLPHRHRPHHVVHLGKW